MVEVVIDRYTPEHRKLRRGPRGIRIGSSDVPVICGLSQYALPVHLWEYMIVIGDTGEGKEDNAQMKHGRICEEFSANMYTTLTGWKIEDGNYHYSDDPRYSDLFGCSVDRKVVVEEGEGEGETKTKKWEGILDIHNPCYSLGAPGVKKDHMAQIQYQLFITKKEWCDHLITHFEFGDPKPDKLIGLRMTRVYFNQKYCDEFLLPQLLEFAECLETKVRPVPGKQRTPPPVHTVEYSFEA